MIPRAWILSIGNELVLGQIVNTNGTWLARKLTLMGFEVKRIISLPDSEDEVVEVLSEALRKGIEVVISTGGLGPTYDDRTSEFIAKAIGEELKLNSEALKMIEEKYRSKGLEITEHRRKMALLPRTAKPIPNPVGTAPGILVEHGNTLIIALPGVPREMQEMFEKYVEEILRARAPKIERAEAWIHVENIPESSLAPIIDKVLRKYPRVYIKSHPKGEELGKPIIKLYVSVTGFNKDKVAETLNNVVENLKEELIRVGAKVSREN